VDYIVLGGDEVIIPVITDQLPEPLVRKVVDVLRLDIRSPEHEVFAATLEAVRHKDEETDESVVRSLIDDYRAGGLAVLGLEGVQKALTISQVHILVISAAPDRIKGGGKTANELVVLANQTGAQVRFIENPELLDGYGGIGASLRFLL
jgi:peptide subunit release factor 1 (eRF1)